MRSMRLSALMWAGVVCLTAAALGAQREGPVSARAEAADRRTAAAAPEAIDGQTSLRAAGPSVEGQIPRLMKFSGLVRDLAGKPLTGPVDVTFALYLEEAGGAPLWFETQTVEANSLGHYTALLGAMTPAGLPAEMFASAEAHWLGVQAGNLPEQPRVLLVSVPYALKAADAETLGGKPASAFQLAPSEAASSVRQPTDKKTSPSASGTPSGAGKKAVTGSSTGTKALTTTGPSTFTCSSTTPCVSVSQGSTGIGLQAVAKTLAVYGVANATTGTTYGVRGLASSTTGRGVFGYASATTGGTIGVYGLAPSTSGVALLGDATATTGGTRGVIGRTKSTSGMGVWGQATATSGATTGVRGDVWSSSGTAGYFDNRAGGKILSGRNNGAEKFSVSGLGDVTTTGSVIAGGLLQGTNVIAGGLLQGANLRSFDENTATGVSALLSNTIGGFNTATGAFALQNNTVGGSNTATGVNALLNNTTSNRNTATGVAALFSNTEGFNNTATGVAALFSNTTGTENTANGDSALQKNTTGDFNTANGESALFSNTTGIENTATGESALFHNTTGFANTAIGNTTGLANQTGDHNTFLGFFAAASSAALTNATAVGANAVVGASNALVLGSIAGQNGAVASVNVGIGTTTPARELEVNGGVRLNTTISKPTCDATTRGTFWITLGGPGVADSVEVCTKDAADVFAWRNVI